MASIGWSYEYFIGPALILSMCWSFFAQNHLVYDTWGQNLLLLAWATYSRFVLLYKNSCWLCHFGPNAKDHRISLIINQNVGHIQRKIKKWILIMWHSRWSSNWFIRFKSQWRLWRGLPGAQSWYKASVRVNGPRGYKIQPELTGEHREELEKAWYHSSYQRIEKNLKMVPPKKNLVLFLNIFCVFSSFLI